MLKRNLNVQKLFNTNSLKVEDLYKSNDGDEIVRLPKPERDINDLEQSDVGDFIAKIATKTGRRGHDATTRQSDAPRSNNKGQLSMF